MSSSCMTMLSVVAALLVCVDATRVKRADDRPELEAVVNQLSERLTQATAQLTALQGQVSQLTARFQSSQTQVAFIAFHGDDPFNVATDGTMMYNTAQINIGGAFNTVTGVFTAPIAGLYVFFANCMSVATTDLDLGILVDGQRYGGCYSFTQEGNGQGANMVTVHLTQGQQVWVHMYRPSRTVRGNVWNSFSGFLVKTD
ncbi:hypothetical protein C0Q70_02218 [Pomacea canaliculata]|uniref:C1q domain-containing protein n=1 Tax=Pomacea canaliculata TaxID=400727 RepID=A0A2T7Q1P2_POMCA|nr:complement C1q tumor necrosis factor-related protein 6-like [Pomacea canaliculata]PVD39583.1 hypothetical protein C0Q70_02218 [Pomacea canaliculata]